MKRKEEEEEEEEERKKKKENLGERSADQASTYLLKSEVSDSSSSSAIVSLASLTSSEFIPIWKSDIVVCM